MSVAFYPPFDDTPDARDSGHKRRIENLEKRPIRKAKVIYHVKVTDDIKPIVAGDAPVKNGGCIWTVPLDVDGFKLIEVEIFQSTPGGGITQVQLRKVGIGDMLSTRVQIDSGEYASKDSGTQRVINAAQSEVAHKQRIAFDIDAVHSAARGLEVVMTFKPPRVTPDS